MDVKKTVLTFVLSDENKLLMIHKKTGQGAGKWNVPGGKVGPGETLVEAAIRETREETGVTPQSLHMAGKLDFRFETGGSWSNDCTVFIATAFAGNLVAETEECTSHWIQVDEIPWDKMWEADRNWAPLVLRGEFFHHRYTFSAKDDLIKTEDLTPTP